MDYRKIAGVLGWVVAAVVVTAGAVDKGEVRARRIVIEDEKGRDCIVLDATGKNPTVTIKRPGAPHEAVRVSVGPDNPLVSLTDQDSGVPGLIMSPHTIHLYGSKRGTPPPIGIGVIDGDDPVILLNDKAGKPMAHLP